MRMPVAPRSVPFAVLALALAGLCAPAGASAGNSPPRRVASVTGWRPAAPRAGSAAIHFAYRQQFLARLPYDNLLDSVEATSKRDAWAVGGTDVAYHNFPDYAVHWNGTAWRIVHFPDPMFVPTSVRASSAHDVWVFGVTFARPPAVAEALRWDGAKWHVMTLPPNTDPPRRPVVLGPSDVWLAGQSAWTSTGGWSTPVWHWDGHAWTSYSLPILGDALDNFTVAGSSNRNLWAVGNLTTSDAGNGFNAAGRLAAYRWSGTAWQRTPLPRVLVTGTVQVAVSASGEAWIAGHRAGRPRNQPVVLYRPGSTWSSLPDRVLDLAIHYIFNPIPDGLDGVWFPFALYWSGRSATGLTSPPSACHGGFYTSPDWSFMAGIPGTHSVLTVAGCQLSPRGKIEGEITLTRVR